MQLIHVLLSLSLINLTFATSLPNQIDSTIPIQTLEYGLELSYQPQLTSQYLQDVPQGSLPDTEILTSKAQALIDERIKLETLNKRKAEEARRLESLRLAEEEKKKQSSQSEEAKPVLQSTTPPPDFETAIREKCAQYGCNAALVISVMYCESGGRPNASNGGTYIGLFQFLPSTFTANAKRIGITSPNIWDPYQQIDVATWMFSRGQERQWPSCTSKYYKSVQ